LSVGEARTSSNSVYRKMKKIDLVVNSW